MKPDMILLEAVSAGNRDALQSLYQRHGLALLNYLIQLIGDRAIAEEVLQDVMLAVWHGADSFRAESTVKTWMFAIARRQAANHLRKNALNTTQLHEESVGYTPKFDDYDDLLNAIEQLPEDQQQALDMIYYRGYSSVEAAKQLNVSVNTFRSRLRRARLTLRRMLGVKP